METSHTASTTDGDVTSCGNRQRQHGDSSPVHRTPRRSAAPGKLGVEKCNNYSCEICSRTGQNDCSNRSRSAQYNVTTKSCGFTPRANDYNESEHRGDDSQRHGPFLGVNDESNYW